MATPDKLKKNQSILWARDVLGRPDECLVVCCDTDADATINHKGQIVVLDTDTGVKLEIQADRLGEPEVLAALHQKLDGKELISAGLTESLTSKFSKAGVKRVYDLMSQYRAFLGMEVNLAANTSGQTLAIWARDVLKTMASSSLTLDQADTGGAKWTSAHFKVTPGMLDKLKGLIK